MMRQRDGFSLIELIIVIFLMLLVYALVFTYYQKKESGVKPLSPANLKKELHKLIPSDKYATFICTRSCEACYLRIGETNSFTPYEEEISLKQTEAYTLDQDETLSLQEYGRFKGDDVCLKIDFYPNGSSTQIVLKTPQKSYFLPAYFGKTQQVDTLEEAQQLWLKNDTMVSDPGDYY